MAKNMKTKAELRISSVEALKVIEELTKKLNALKNDFGKDSDGLTLRPQIDQKQLDKVEKAIKNLQKSVTDANKNIVEQSNKSTEQQVKNVRKLQNIYDEYNKKRMSAEDQYVAKLKKNAQDNQFNNQMSQLQKPRPSDISAGAWTLMTNKARQPYIESYEKQNTLPNVNNLFKQALTPSLMGATALEDKDYLRSNIATITFMKTSAEKLEDVMADARERWLSEKTAHDELVKAIDKEAKERAEREKKFAQLDQDDENTMAKVRELRSKSAGMGLTRRQKHADQYNKNLDKDISNLQKELTKDVKEYNREQAQAQKEQARLAKEADRERKAALREQAMIEREMRQAEIDALRNHIAQVAIWKQGLQTVNQLFQQGIQIYDQFRGVGLGVLNGLSSSANQIFSVLGLSVDSILADSVAQEEKLQMARIGFKNMFGEEQVASLEDRVRETAAQSPGLNSGDLADYIAQLGAVTSSADQAYDVTMGILKTVQYGGGDANQEMNYIIKNIRDVMAKGKATQVDIQQFNRAMPLLTKALEEVGASSFLKDGQLTITKDNARTLVNAFSSLNSEDNPAYNVFNDTGKTWLGTKEEFYETTQNLVNSALREVGFYDALQDIMRNGIFPIISDASRYFTDLLTRINKGTNWKEIQNQLKTSWDAIVEAGKTFIDGLIEAFGEVDENGNIDITSAINTIIKMIENFIKGMIDGANQIVKMVGWLRDTMGDEGLANLMGAMGWSVTAGGITSKLASGAGNFINGAGQLGMQLYQNRLLEQLTNIQSGGEITKKAGIFSRIGNSIGGAFNSWNPTNKVGIAAKTVAGGVGKAGNYLASNFSMGKLAGGLGIMGLSNSIGDLVMDLNLLGDASKAAGSTIDVAGSTIGGALMGSMYGPIGAVSMGLVGLVTGLTSAEKKLQELDVKEQKETFNEEFSKEIVDLANQSAELMTKQGSKMDWASDEGRWVKNAFQKELSGMTQEEIRAKANDGSLYRRFTELSNMKQRQVAMSLIDNEEGFWNLKGQNVKLVNNNGDGTFSATEWGTRLANIIRSNNMVGYDDATKLAEASDTTLVQDYLKQKGEKANGVVNSTQIERLEEASKDVATRVAESTTKLSDNIQLAIKEADGNLQTAIKNAYNGGNDALAEVLSLYQALKNRTKQTTDAINGVLTDDTLGDVETIRGSFGDAAGDAMQKWNDHTSSWKGAVDYYTNNDFMQLYHLTGRAPSKVSFNSMHTLAQKMKNDLQTAIDDPLITDEQRSQMQEAQKEVSSLINDMYKLDGGDWNGLLKIMRKLKDLTEALGIFVIDHNNKWYTDKNFFGNDIGKASGGYIKPIYRAGGGGAKGVDTIAAMLSPGEFVQRASAVRTAGLGVMNALNQGDLTQAYRLLGSKISNHNNNSKSWSSVDSHNTSNKQTVINYNYNRSARASAYFGQRNFMAVR